MLSEISLNISVVGCGPGGLAVAYCLGRAGHKVTLFENAHVIAEVGAGIQLSPNLTRLLIRWGLGDKLKDVSVVPKAVTFRRWQTGERIGWTQWGENLEAEHGAPYYHVHRADLVTLLFDLAEPFMTLRLNSKVVSVDPATPSLTLLSGEVIESDVIIASDGVNSIVRNFVLGGPSQSTPTGDLAYRMLVPASEMLKDPLLKSLIDTPEMTGWLGPGRHIIGYCIRKKEYYNVVAICPDTEPLEAWSMEGSAERMRAQFVGWEPRVQRLLALVPPGLACKLMDHAPLKTWVHKDGKVALLGDACHPMLPCRAQGAAMAFEDAAVLGNLFSRFRDRSQIGSLLREYQALRYDRTGKTQRDSRINCGIFHLDDGPLQKSRDESMRRAMVVSLWEARGECPIELRGFSTNGIPTMWSNKAGNDFQFGYDPDVEMKKWWEQKKRVERDQLYHSLL